MRPLTSVKLLEDNVIPFRFRVDNLTILIAFAFIATVAVQYFFYILQGRWTTHMPTLTETAACSPNSMIFASVFSILAFILFLLFHVIITWGEVYGVFKSRFILVSQIFSFISPLLLVVTANFSVSDSLLANYFGTIPFFIVTTIWFIMLLVKLYKHMKQQLRILRIVVISISMLSVLIAYIPLPIGFAANATKKAICHLIFLSAMIIFVASFRDEIGRLKVDLLIFADDY